MKGKLISSFILVCAVVCLALIAGCISGTPAGETDSIPAPVSEEPVQLEPTQAAKPETSKTWIMITLSSSSVKQGSDISLTGAVTGDISTVTVTVNDSGGNEVLMAEVDPAPDGSFSYTIDTADLDPGMYYVMATLPGGIYSKAMFMVE